MKKIIAIIFLFVSANVSAQNSATEDTIAKAAITEIGKPNGEKTEMKIGKEGGSIASSDGKVSLIFPQGALSKKTTISIQPTTNLAPNGNGKAYKMVPSGINFQKPVQIIFNYNENEIEGNSPQLLGIAMQDEKGQWFSLNKAVTDTVAKTLTVGIRHFSSYVNFSRAKINPAAARVKVNGSRRLQIVGAFTEDTDEDAELIPLFIEYPTMNWSVNEIHNGNSSIGIISVSQRGSAIFQAPAQIPQQNPVAVSVKEQLRTSFLNRYHVSRLVSNITIYDGDYEVKMVNTLDAPAGSMLGAVKYKDYGSFIISLNKIEAKITEIVNKNAEWTYNGKCTVVQLNPGHGNINIIGVQNIKLIPAASPGDNPWVEIFFVRSPTMFPLLQFTCPKVNAAGTFTTTSAGANAIGSMIPAFPMSIKFEAKEGEQTILKIGEEGGESYVKFTVKQIRED